MNLNETLKKLKILERTIFLGNLTKVFQFTDEPRFFQYSCNPKKIKNCNDESGSIAISLNENEAKVKSLMEYLERFCLENNTKKVLSDSYINIKDIAIDPADFLNFRDEEMDFRRQEYIKKIRKTQLNWVEGVNLKTNGKVMVPTQLVYIGHSFQEPLLLRPQISTGAAAYTDYDRALSNGILECVERDSFMLRYLSKDKVPKIELEGKLKQLEEYFKRYNLDINVFNITTDLKIPSFMCLNIDRTGIGPAVSIGLKSGLNINKAIEGAILESQQVRQWIRYFFLKMENLKLMKKT